MLYNSNMEGGTKSHRINFLEYTILASDILARLAREDELNPIVRSAVIEAFVSKLGMNPAFDEKKFRVSVGKRGEG
jgi:hypothetical protein